MALLSIEEYIQNSPSPYHAVQTAVEILKKNGFTHVKETEVIPTDKPAVYTRDSTSFLAYIPGTDLQKGFAGVVGHTDSPTIRVTQSGTISCNGSIFNIPCEPYAGPSMQRWLDRKLQIAGRINYIDNKKITMKLVRKSSFCFIPHVAPHVSADWFPTGDDFLVCCANTENKLQQGMTIDKFIKAVFDIPKQAEITCHNLEISAEEINTFGNVIQCPRLDDLASVYSSVISIVQSLQSLKTTSHTRMILGVNNEEIGSQTRAGAEGPMIANWWSRLCANKLDSNQIYGALARSYVASADGGHAKHPAKGAPSCADPVPVCGSGFILKYSQKQNYAYTDHCITAAKAICQIKGIAYQNWINRAYKGGGGTIGNIIAAQQDLNVVDCGVAMLGMHSCLETIDKMDLEGFTKFCQGVIELGCEELEKCHAEMNE